jgi:glycosyltransferase involved in cell wall biosynthesis
LVGRISPSKGQHIFLKAAAQVHRRFPDVRFQIIGAALFNERDYERQVRQLASDLELQDQVEFTGFRDDVPRLISNMEILVHASVTAEPFGQVIAEGMAAGKPVVATAGGGVLEIVLDRVTGLLVGMGDVDEMSAAICRLLEDPEAAKRMGERGRARVLEHFNIKETVAKIEGVYDEVLAARASGNNDPAETSLLPVVRNIQ